jgi:DNA-directed RNA polymerase subunit E'/Rpb7
MEASAIDTDSSNTSIPPPPPPPKENELSIGKVNTEIYDDNYSQEVMFPGTPSGTPPQVQIDRYNAQQLESGPQTPSGTPPQVQIDRYNAQQLETGPQTPSGTPPQVQIDRYNKQQTEKGPQTPEDSPPELKSEEWDPMIREKNEKTGTISVRPRYDKNEHGNIQYYYRLLEDEDKKKIAGLPEDVQVDVLKSIEKKLNTKYPDNNENSAYNQLEELKTLNIQQEIINTIKDNETKNVEKLELDNSSVNRVKSALDKKQRKNKGELYSEVLDNTKILLGFKEVNKNIKTIIEKKVKSKFEKKCNINGYVKNNSIKVINYSSGALKGGNIEFTIVFQYKVCYPVEGNIINCRVKNVTKAGIRAEIVEKNEPTPLVIFIARDHNNNNDDFITIKEDENIDVKIIGKRFELNDTYISVIGELAPKEIM